MLTYSQEVALSLDLLPSPQICFLLLPSLREIPVVSVEMSHASVLSLFHLQKLSFVNVSCTLNSKTPNIRAFSYPVIQNSSRGNARTGENQQIGIGTSNSHLLRQRAVPECSRLEQLCFWDTKKEQKEGSKLNSSLPRKAQKSDSQSLGLGKGVCVIFSCLNLQMRREITKQGREKVAPYPQQSLHLALISLDF